MLIVLLSAAIQAHSLAQDVRFYPDEALFSTFARNAALGGDWLLHGDLDKTPLAIYADAVTMRYVAASEENGVPDFAPQTGEFAARLPGTLASIVLTAITYALAQTLYRRRSVSAWAALFVALSPYSAVYGATAFTDGLMLTLAALSALLAARGAWLWGGVAMALAFASKQQALYLLPLAWALGWGMNQLNVRRAAAYLAPLGAGAALLTGWDALRAQPTSLWALAAANNNPARLIRSGEVGVRLETWLNYARTLVGTPTIVLGIAALAMVSAHLLAPRDSKAALPHDSAQSSIPLRRDWLIDIILVVYLLAYFLIQWLVAFNLYPRYLLPMLIPAALLASRTVVWLWTWLRPRLSPAEGILLAAALVLTLTVGARNSSEARAELTEDGTDYGGILALAEYLNAQPLGAVVYDHWLGWELGYYLGQWTDKRRVYYPTPEALAADALMLDDPAPRYLAAPTGEPIDPWLDALREAGFTVEQVYLRQSFIVYRVTPP